MDMVANLDDDALRARVLSVYGTALAHAGQPRRAIGFLVEATARYHALGRPVPVAICLTNAAEIAFGLRWYEEALAMLRHSLAMLRHSRAVPREADAWFLGALLDGFAKVHLRLGRPRTAVRYATASLAHSERMRNTFQRVHTLHWRSLAWHELGNDRDAVDDAWAAVALARDSGGPELELEALRHLAAVYWMTGDDRAAETLALADELVLVPSPGAPDR
jgi:tetratricopeptide (TPR) repeat protein